MSFDERDWAREEYDSYVASQVLAEDGLRYALEEKAKR